jgi:hypothetical protein
MLQQKMPPVDGDPSVRKKLQGDKHQHVLLDTPSWPFSGMSLWSRPSGTGRGTAGTGPKSEWAGLNVRTMDGYADLPGIRDIANRLPLKFEQPKSRGPKADDEKPAELFFSCTEGGFLTGRISFENPRAGNMYLIMVTAPASVAAQPADASSPARTLALKIGRELFAMKEKPYFKNDEGSTDFEKALATIS